MSETFAEALERERRARRLAADEAARAVLAIAPDDREYLRRIPPSVPAGRRLVHNSVRPTRHLGSRGFRAWLEQPTLDRRKVFGCGWAPELGIHYRMVPVDVGDLDEDTAA